MSTSRHAPAQTRAIWPPEPGFFAVRLHKGGWRVPAEIRHTDGLWCAIVDGAARMPHADPETAQDIARVWHGGVRIDQATYAWLIAVRDAAASTDPEHPALHPNQPINHARLKPLAIHTGV